MLLGGATANVAQIRKAIEVGAVGIIVGAVSDAVLRAYLGYDIGVAITGQEDVPLTLILTEGFGQLAMAQRTFALLDALQGTGRLHQRRHANPRRRHPPGDHRARGTRRAHAAAKPESESELLIGCACA